MCICGAPSGNRCVSAAKLQTTDMYLRRTDEQRGNAFGVDVGSVGTEWFLPLNFILKCFLQFNGKWRLYFVIIQIIVDFF